MCLHFYHDKSDNHISSRKREKDKMPKAYEMKNNLAFISSMKKKNFSLFSFVAYLIIMIVHETIKKKEENFHACGREDNLIY